MGEGIIQAAGGVVARGAPAARQYLVIHRRRYRDWCLPKGKLKPGETAEQAALREVREETGYEVELGPYLGEMRYAVNEVPKIVSFWSMRPVGRAGGIQDSSEVREIAWMSGDDALARLDYPLEREMLARAMELDV
jgi:8-oxo-dGTP pyrophosphatase MutT (NUDIX family)